MSRRGPRRRIHRWLSPRREAQRIGAPTSRRPFASPIATFGRRVVFRAGAARIAGLRSNRIRNAAFASIFLFDCNCFGRNVSILDRFSGHRSSSNRISRKSP